MSITLRESEVSLGGPAPFANRFYISVIAGSIVRISFAEQFVKEEDPHFRSAVSLPIQDAISLADLLKTLVQKSEASASEALQ